MTAISFTGHRFLLYKDVERKLADIHARYPDAIWITGGAVGLDSHAARFAMLNGIRLWLICPFPPAVMSAKWGSAQKEVLIASIKYAERYSVLSPVFGMRFYQDRNVRMVDLSTLLCAFFDGSPGGTANCVRYARSVNKQIEMCLGVV